MARKKSLWQNPGENWGELQVRPGCLGGKRDFRRLYSANYEAESGEFLHQLTNYGAQSRVFLSLEGKINPGISNFGHLPPHLALSGVLL